MFELIAEQRDAQPQPGSQQILFMTSDRFPPFRPAAKAVFADGLARKGHRIDWLLQAAGSGTRAGLRRYGSGIALVAPSCSGESRLDRLRKYWRDFRNDLKIFTLLRRRRYSVIQVKDKYIGALVAIVAAKLHGITLVYWLAYPHGEASIYAARTGIARYGLFYELRGRIQTWLLYRVILPASAHVFVQSEQMRTDIAERGIRPGTMTPVQSTVNLADFDAVLKDPAESDGHTIVYLGTLLRERQLDILVRALAVVRRRCPKARLLFVGRGENPEDEAMLRREAQRLEIESAVEITGWLPAQEAWTLVRKASVCVSPYCPIPILLSTSPTKLIEYMALGRPVVGNDHPEQSDVIERSGAGIVCRWDEAEFADAIVDLLRDPVRAETMGRAGRRFVELYRTHSTMVSLVASSYERLLRGSFDATSESMAPAESRSGMD